MTAITVAMWPIWALPVTGIASDVQQLELPATVELYELDLSPLGVADIYRFHDGTNIMRQQVVWQGQTYTAFPITSGGFDMSTNGQLPRPKLQVSNVEGSITALLLAFNDLVGAKLTRHRTLSKYLDAVNFPGNVNPNADPDAAMADDIFFIDRKSMETDEMVEFELCAAFDVTGVQLPRRQVVQNVCPWKYRGSECGYAGPPISDIRDNPLSSSIATAPTEVAYFNARANWTNMRNARIAAQQNVALKQNAMAVANEVVLIQDSYSTTYPNMRYVVSYNYDTVFQGWWNNSPVGLGGQFRIGALVLDDIYRGAKYYHIQYWDVNGTAAAAALANYNTAVAALSTAQTNETNALAAYQAAIAALPIDGAVYTADACGKRLASCKLRFVQPDQSGILPFGGFPAVGLVS